MTVNFDQPTLVVLRSRLNGRWGGIHRAVHCHSFLKVLRKTLLSKILPSESRVGRSGRCVAHTLKDAKSWAGSISVCYAAVGVLSVFTFPSVNDFDVAIIGAIIRMCVSE